MKRLGQKELFSIRINKEGILGKVPVKSGPIRANPTVIAGSIIPYVVMTIVVDSIVTEDPMAVFCLGNNIVFKMNGIASRSF